MTLIKGDQFRVLPRKEQAGLMRLVANYYLLTGENIEFVRGLLNTAWSLHPFNPKTTMILVLANLHPGLAQSIVRRWEHWNRTKRVYTAHHSKW